MIWNLNNFLSDSIGNTEHLFSGVATSSCSLSDGGKWQRFDKNIFFMGCSLFFSKENRINLGKYSFSLTTYVDWDPGICQPFQFYTLVLENFIIFTWRRAYKSIQSSSFTYKSK